ncbi:helix-turn-helix domain-containing protein [Fervidibacillus halotolerans]|uniref:Helix-turn-helix domain-containing protein n=1 Tax=Fervidibacillus halotolerans TaxID=2980027 RepID=A0A9E8M151_9BACI|nr:RodZ family helix-turn-helix domain-containing protein [Fervidibacillus halotolerans]WAA13540.1 helix-turn-helix domain-containing protein [Fervidibacillus halotolerans]
MTELGKRLREAREEKGLTLDDLQNITKIQKRYLAGIEEGKYDIIPGKFYVRAFIKQYAEAVGLEPERLFEEFKTEIPSVYEDDLPEQLSRTHSRREISTNSKLFEIFPKILLTIFIIGLAILVWYFAQKILTNTLSDQSTDPTTDDLVEIGESGTPPENKETEVDNSDESENSDPSVGNDQTETDEGEGEEKSQELTAVESDGENTLYELKNAERFELKIKATKNGATWIKIFDENNNVLQDGVTLNDNNPEIIRDFSEEDTVNIRIGRAYETEIYINDEKLTFMNDPNENVTQNIIIRYVVKEGE